MSIKFVNNPNYELLLDMSDLLRPGEYTEVDVEMFYNAHDITVVDVELWQDAIQYVDGELNEIVVNRFINELADLVYEKKF